MQKRLVVGVGTGDELRSRRCGRRRRLGESSPTRRGRPPEQRPVPGHFVARRMRDATEEGSPGRPPPARATSDSRRRSGRRARRRPRRLRSQRSGQGPPDDRSPWRSLRQGRRRSGGPGGARAWAHACTVRRGGLKSRGARSSLGFRFQGTGFQSEKGCVRFLTPSRVLVRHEVRGSPSIPSASATAFHVQACGRESRRVTAAPRRGP